jgi:hypothetical protein
MSNSDRRRRLTSKLARVSPTRITPKDSLLSLTSQASRSGKRLIPQFDEISALAKSRKLSQKREEQRSERTPLTKNLLKKPDDAATSSILPKPLLRRRQASKFLSVLVNRTKFSKKKRTVLKCHGETAVDTEKKSHMGQGKKLLLFQSLRREPLTFLELHKRFSVSRQTLMGLVQNGFLKEVWGKNGVGMKFTITTAGKRHLKGLEESASYGPKIRRVAQFRLNERTVP